MTRASKPAVGHRHKVNGMRRVVCSFDDDTFDQLRSYAESNRISFGEAVRTVVDWGLIDLSDGSRGSAA